jgi:hypothetical protein
MYRNNTSQKQNRSESGHLVISRIALRQDFITGVGNKNGE